MPASQSALLLGPEHFLRWGCRSMSSCDGVRPIVVEPVQIIPKGSPTPHTKALANPLVTGHQPENWHRVSMFWDFGSIFGRQGHYCSGTSVRSTRGVAASFLTRCRGSRILRPSLRRHKPAEHRIPDVSATPDVEASSITSCCGRRVLLSERRCGVTVCLQSRRRQPVLHLSQSDFCSPFECIMVAQFGWRRFRFTWHQVSVLISRGGRAEPRPWHQTFCRDTSQRLHSRQQKCRSTPPQRRANSP